MRNQESFPWQTLTSIVVILPRRVLPVYVVHVSALRLDPRSIALPCHVFRVDEKTNNISVQKKSVVTQRYEQASRSSTKAFASRKQQHCISRKHIQISRRIFLNIPPPLCLNF